MTVNNGTTPPPPSTGFDNFISNLVNSAASQKLKLSSLCDDIDPIRDFTTACKFNPTNVTSLLGFSYSSLSLPTLSVPNISSGSTTSTTSNTTTGTGTGAGTIKTSLDDYLYLPTMKSMAFPDFTKSINALLLQKLEHLVTHNTQVLVIGAALGAAISAGVAIGLFSAWSVFSGFTGKPFGGLYRKTKSWLGHNGGDGSGSDSSTNIDRQDHNNPQHMNTVKIIQGHTISSTFANLSTVSAQDQCRQCLDAITASLGKQRLAWDSVLRISAHLKSDCDCDRNCDATVFREVLKEYPMEEGTAVVILYVQRLEEENACVQVEALVQK